MRPIRLFLVLVAAVAAAACGGELEPACMVCVEHAAANGGCTWWLAVPAPTDGGACDVVPVAPAN